MLDAKRSIVSKINDQTKKSESLFKIFHPRSPKIPSGRANVPVEQHRPLFTRPVKNPPIGCNKLVYKQFEPERQPWYVSTISSLSLQPLCPNPALQSGSICSPRDTGSSWNVVENSRRLAQGKDDKSWFRGIDMPCCASRKRCWKRDRDRWIPLHGG